MCTETAVASDSLCTDNIQDSWDEFAGIHSSSTVLAVVEK